MCSVEGEAGYVDLGADEVFHAASAVAERGALEEVHEWGAIAATVNVWSVLRQRFSVGEIHTNSGIALSGVDILATILVYGARYWDLFWGLEGIDNSAQGHSPFHIA